MSRSPGADLFALHLRAYADAIPEAEREHEFVPGRAFAFDFAWPAHKLAVEVDGGVHRIRGRWQADLEKFRCATILGWQVLHFSPDEVRQGMAIDVIRAAFRGEVKAVLAAAQRRHYRARRQP
jgi:very-short-patch-repair endonuclease